MKRLAIITRVSLILVLCISKLTGYAQLDSSHTNIDSIAELQKLPDKALRFIDKKQVFLTAAIDKQTQKLLERMAKKEAKLQKKLQGIDSVKAQQVFAGTQAKYLQLQQRLKSPLDGAASPLKEYMPGIDSLQSSMQFLQKLNPALPADKLAQISSITSKVQQLQGKMQTANEVEAFIKQRNSS